MKDNGGAGVVVTTSQTISSDSMVSKSGDITCSSLLLRILRSLSINKWIFVCNYLDPFLSVSELSQVGHTHTGRINLKTAFSL